MTVDAINETSWQLLRNGTIVQAFRNTLEISFLGFWIWAIILITIDAVILLKTRNAFLTSTINLILLIVLYEFFPAQIFLYLLIPSILAVAGALYINWR